MLILALLSVAALVFIDVLIKGWAIETLKPLGSMDFLKIGDTDIIGFRYAENTGAAFSAFNGAGTILSVVVSVILAGVIFYAFTEKHKTIFKTICYVMIVSGGIGNLIDRFKQGYVVDYIEVRLFDFAIFNFADILITVGAFMYIIAMIISERNTDKLRAGRIRSEVRNKYK
jgi:signal peptidase II